MKISPLMSAFVVVFWPFRLYKWQIRFWIIILLLYLRLYPHPYLILCIMHSHPLHTAVVWLLPHHIQKTIELFMYMRWWCHNKEDCVFMCFFYRRCLYSSSWLSKLTTELMFSVVEWQSGLTQPWTENLWYWPQQLNSVCVCVCTGGGTGQWLLNTPPY